jgi:hypothetical protein
MSLASFILVCSAFVVGWVSGVLVDRTLAKMGRGEQ